MSPLEFYPWQRATAQRWLQQRERFAHAWLIHGLAGIGKTQFAKAGAAALLCEQPQSFLACGQCDACQWVQSGNHPDLRWVRPDAVAAIENPDDPTIDSKTPSKWLRVEQLRALTDWFNTATHRGGYRVAVLYPAEALNPVSSNALLKILEEPPTHTVFLLVADRYQQLLPTIISRCRRLPLSTPDHTTSLAWLQAQMVQTPEAWLAAAGGAPLAAYRLAQQMSKPYPDWLEQLQNTLLKGQEQAIIALASEIEKEPATQWLTVLQRWYVDLLLACYGQPVRYYPDLQVSTQLLSQRSHALRLQQQWKWLLTQKQHSEHPLNAKLWVHTALERVIHSFIH